MIPAKRTGTELRALLVSGVSMLRAVLGLSAAVDLLDGHPGLRRAVARLGAAAEDVIRELGGVR